MTMKTRFGLAGFLIVLISMPASAQIPVEYSEASGSFFYGGSWHADYPLREELSRADVSRTIYRTDVLSENLNEEVFSERMYVFYTSEGYISEHVLSPTGEHVALRESFFEQDVPIGRRANYVVRRPVGNEEVVDRYYENSRLVVLNVRGEPVVDPIDFVRDYVWSPSGDKIAYVTGTYYEGGMGFVSTGTWILDLESRARSMVHSSGWDLSWAEWDGRLYIWQISGQPADVLRYDAVEGLEPTPHRGVYFSSNGEYYFDPGREGEPARLFQTDGDLELTGDHPAFGFRGLQPRRWLGDQILVMQGSDLYAGELIYRLDEKTTQGVDGLVVERLRRGGEPLTLVVVNLLTGRIEEMTVD